jgi:hypothetical protein
MKNTALNCAGSSPAPGGGPEFARGGGGGIERLGVGPSPRAVRRSESWRPGERLVLAAAKRGGAVWRAGGWRRAIVLTGR